MVLSVFTPVLADQSATCRVSGNNKRGHVKVKVNGQYRLVLPDEHPGVQDDRRLVFCPPSGRGYDVWTEPAWQSGDTLTFELFDSNDVVQASQQTTVL